MFPDKLQKIFFHLIVYFIMGFLRNE